MCRVSPSRRSGQTMRDPFPDRTDDAFQKQMLDSVNALRARHGVPALTLDPKLVDYAKSRAQTVSTYPGLEEGHRGLAKEYGEDLFWGGSFDNPRPATDASNDWYSEIADYNYTTSASNSPNDPNVMIGHFTQLV